ncbi:hypothetical protein BD626DRAFT_428435 [Schizophyllum amplum]|uniref:Protein kinase domain-containing protein n=1 Tax=Schizophyllum amplum TaxID=97359 RepID=A0A550CKI2_9AGAR|nr:hypothetical protein BD626DRAFT_428435 [Auriculariopsis ampla]
MTTIMSQQPLFGDKSGVSIRFAGTDTGVILRPIKYRCKGVDANTFHTLPDCRLVTALPRMSGKTLPFEKYSTWCTEWFTGPSLVFYAETKPAGGTTTRQRFAIKVAFDIEGTALGSKLKDNLRQEALFYHQNLGKLQGDAVPKHYGVWYGRTSWGVTIACAIMEWGGMPYSRRFFDGLGDRADRRLKVMQALKAVHDAGYQHNNLMHDHTHHFLYDTERERACIIDFACADKHVCHLNMPMKEYTTPPAAHIFGCEELCDLACALHFFGVGPSYGRGADPEVQAANERAKERYLRQCAIREAKERTDALAARRLRAPLTDRQYARRSTLRLTETNGQEDGVTIRFAGTDSSGILRPINYGCKGVDANSFHTLPDLRLATALPRMRGKVIPFDKYSKWCYDWFTRPSLVFYAETVSSDPTAQRLRFAIKTVFNIEGSSSVEHLRQEALFYHKHLSKLQGDAVPKHYGVWQGRTCWGGTVACAIMEWGGLPYRVRIFDKCLKRADRRMKVMQALKAVHDAGFQHNNLMDDDTHHYLYDADREKAFIVDFASVQKHACHLNLPMKEYHGPPAAHIFGCQELHDLATTIRFFGKGPSYGPGADPEVREANEQAKEKYLRDCAIRDAKKRAAGHAARQRLQSAGDAGRQPSLACSIVTPVRVH